MNYSLIFKICKLQANIWIGLKKLEDIENLSRIDFF